MTFIFGFMMEGFYERIPFTMKRNPIEQESDNAKRKIVAKFFQLDMFLKQVLSLAAIKQLLHLKVVLNYLWIQTQH